jgi:prophage regulatory protein
VSNRASSAGRQMSSAPKPGAPPACAAGAPRGRGQAPHPVRLQPAVCVISPAPLPPRPRPARRPGPAIATEGRDPIRDSVATPAGTARSRRAQCQLAQCQTKTARDRSRHVRPGSSRALAALHEAPDPRSRRGSETSKARHAMSTRKPDRILRLPAVLERTGFSRSTLYRRVEEGGFPRHLKISERCIGWRESEIRAWERKQKAARRRLAADPRQPVPATGSQRRGGKD